MVCTCAPWCARAEFQATDSANLAAVKGAVDGYLAGIANSLSGIRQTADNNLPALSTIQSDLQTLRSSLGVTLPSMLQHLQTQTLRLSSIHSDTDDAAFSLYNIDQTLDDVADSLVNQPSRLASLDDEVHDIGLSLDTAVSELSDGRFELGEVDDSIGDVDDSIGDLTEGLSGTGQQGEELEDLPEFHPHDIDDEVKPFEDGQATYDQGHGSFLNSFKSFLLDMWYNVIISDFWGIEGYQYSLKTYLCQAPTEIILAPSFSLLGYTIPDLKIDWFLLKSSTTLSVVRNFTKAIMVGMFGMAVFYRVGAVV